MQTAAMFSVSDHNVSLVQSESPHNCTSKMLYFLIVWRHTVISHSLWKDIWLTLF